MKNKFALNIKNLRILAGLKQNDLAKVLNTTQRKVSYWERVILNQIWTHYG